VGRLLFGECRATVKRLTQLSVLSGSWKGSQLTPNQDSKQLKTVSFIFQSLLGEGNKSYVVDLVESGEKSDPEGQDLIRPRLSLH